MSMPEFDIPAILSDLWGFVQIISTALGITSVTAAIAIVVTLILAWYGLVNFARQIPYLKNYSSLVSVVLVIICAGSAYAFGRLPVIFHSGEKGNFLTLATERPEYKDSVIWITINHRTALSNITVSLKSLVKEELGGNNKDIDGPVEIQLATPEGENSFRPTTIDRYGTEWWPFLSIKGDHIGFICDKNSKPECNRILNLGRVDEFWRDGVFGIPEVNRT